MTLITRAPCGNSRAFGESPFRHSRRAEGSADKPRGGWHSSDRPVVTGAGTTPPNASAKHDLGGAHPGHMILWLVLFGTDWSGCVFAGHGQVSLNRAGQHTPVTPTGTT